MNRKGDSKMKKISIILVIVATMVLALTGCGDSFRHDENHAKVIMTTASGYSDVTRSFNGAGKTISGQELALRNKGNFSLKRGDKLHLTFECEACGDIQEFDIENAWAKIISCKCPEKIDKNGNAKEYYAISVNFEE